MTTPPRWQVERRTFPLALRDGTVTDITVGDVYDDDIALPYLRLVENCTTERNPDYVRTDPHEWLTLTRDPSWGDDVVIVARKDGVVVGGARAMLCQLDNTDKASVFVDVAAGYRRRGLGTALMRLLEESIPASRTVLMWDATSIDAAVPIYQGCAAAWGYAESDRSVGMRLALPPCPQRLTAVEASIGTHADDYTFRTVVGGIADDALAVACERLQGEVRVDAPTGDVTYEAGHADLARYRERCSIWEEAGGTFFDTMAFTNGGDLVAHTQLIATNPTQARIVQDGTYVLPAHRGHRLGLAIKLRNLRRAVSDFPHYREVKTTNSAANMQMVAVNEALGFVPYFTLLHFVKRRSGREDT